MKTYWDFTNQKRTIWGSVSVFNIYGLGVDFQIKKNRFYITITILVVSGFICFEK